MASLRRYLVEPISIALERGPHFVGVFRTLINSRDPTAMTGIVIEYRFDDVRQDAKVSETGGDRSS